MFKNFYQIIIEPILVYITQTQLKKQTPPLITCGGVIIDSILLNMFLL